MTPYLRRPSLPLDCRCRGCSFLAAEVQQSAGGASGAGAHRLDVTRVNMTQSRRIVMRQLTLSWAQPRASGAGGGESGADTAKQQQPRGSRKRRRSEPPGAKRSLLAFFNGDRPGAQSARPADPQAGSPDRSDSRPAADPEAPGAGDAGEEEDSIAPLLAPSVPASPPAPTPPEPSTSSSVQDYQQARSERLRRNAEMLAQLGLKPLSAELGAATAPNPTKRKPRASKRERARAIAEALPRRRSLRRAAKDGPAAAADAPAGGVEGAEANTEAAEESDGEKPEDYGASHILSYECGEDSEQRLAPAPEANELFLGVAPWPGGPRRFDDPQLKRVYTMDMCPAGRLLAAAGHGGRCVHRAAGSCHFPLTLVRATRTGRRCSWCGGRRRRRRRPPRGGPTGAGSPASGACSSPDSAPRCCCRRPTTAPLLCGTCPAPSRRCVRGAGAVLGHPRLTDLALITLPRYPGIAAPAGAAVPAGAVRRPARRLRHI